MSASRTIIADDDERLPNVHPGEILRDDFLVGGEISVADVAEGSGVSRAMLDRLLAEEEAIDAEVGLRLARYFGMSEGFFVGLQLDHDVEEARDRHRDALDRIIPRAA